MAVRGNSIHSNGGLGINLLPPPFGTVDGATPNDRGDGDDGANLLQNYPVVDSATSDGTITTISGTLNSTPHATFYLDFYASETADSSGFGEGQTFLTTVARSTSAAGDIDFTAVLPFAIPERRTVTATATDTRGNTSELSAAVPVNHAPTVMVARGGACGGHHSARINLTVNDIDQSASSLTLSARSSNPALVPLANIRFAGSGAWRTLTATAVAGRTGTAVLRVRVRDGRATASIPVILRAGGNFDNRLAGGADPDLLLGRNGDDLILGAGGNDLLCGGPGDDRLTGGPGGDRFSGGPGKDTASDINPAQGDTQDGTIP